MKVRRNISRKRRTPIGISAALFLFTLIIFLSIDAYARVGGGHSYSGGGHSGGSSGGGGGGGGLIFQLIIELLFHYPAIGVPLLIIVIVYFVYSQRNAPQSYSSRATGSEAGYRERWAQMQRATTEIEQPGPATISAYFEGLRKYDPNFSEILFTDFIYTLYARVQEARGRKDLDSFSPYLAAGVIDRLQELNRPELKAVTGVIVGASRVIDVTDPIRLTIEITVVFETNYTEIYGTNGAEGSNTWYNRERWHFKRKRDLLSRRPEKITAMHCPKCGGPLEKRADGSCAYCGVKITGGDFDWFVTEMYILERESKGPLLTEDVPEEGTDLPTAFQYNFQAARERFMTLNPDFSWQKFEARICHIFMELQQAWSNLQWERARPYETDNTFQMHMFWITEYQRQQLRNVLQNISIEQIIPVKISTDAFYDAITVRIYASMLDYTVDLHGRVVSGNPHRTRRFSEYWTFIRRRGIKSSDKENSSCPNCGAPLKISMAGVCEYCGGKITSGEFDWVLSRIEQDESYQYGATFTVQN